MNNTVQPKWHSDSCLQPPSDQSIPTILLPCGVAIKWRKLFHINWKLNYIIISLSAISPIDKYYFPINISLASYRFPIHTSPSVSTYHCCSWLINTSKNHLANYWTKKHTMFVWWTWTVQLNEVIFLHFVLFAYLLHTNTLQQVEKNQHILCKKYSVLCLTSYCSVGPFSERKMYQTDSLSV